MNDIYIRIRLAFMRARVNRLRTEAIRCSEAASQAHSDALAYERKASRIEIDMRAVSVGLIATE